MKKSLKELKTEIVREVPFVGIKPYSHNIIALLLRSIAKQYGKAEANKCIDKFNLQELGWRKEM